MNRCPECKTLVLGGGHRIDGGKPFCRKACAEISIFRRFAQMIPPDVVREEAARVRAGACPRCGNGDGTVNCRLAHSVWSLIKVTFWHHESFIGCRHCHRKRLVFKSIKTLLLGWWSIHGIFMTPVFLVRNVIEWCRKDAEGLSDLLVQKVHFDLVLKLARDPSTAKATASNALATANSPS